jgi:nucleoside-diphosphate-sugar epimerase
MKKVFLTGGTGLIGTETIPFLTEAGFEIYALTIGDEQDTPNVKYIKANLFDKQEINRIMATIKPDYLLHYAWLSTGLFNDNSNFDFLTASIDLLKSFAQNGGKRVVMAGSYAEYGYHNDTLSEDMPAEPINLYSQCKDFVHQISESYCKNNNISFGWARIFSAFGKERDPRRLTSDVINHLKANEPVIIRSGSLVRDYIYVKDIAAAFVKFLDSDVEGVVNICTGKDTSIHDYVMTIAKAMGKENLVIFNEQPSPQQVRVVGNSTRLKREVGFTPKYTIEQAIKEILE